MKSTISSKDRTVPPEVERIERGEHRLVRAEPLKNLGLVDALLACPEKDWFQPVPSEFTRSIEPRS